MSNYHQLSLRQGKEQPVKRFHPWIFSGAIQKLPKLNGGDMVEVVSWQGEVLGYGFYETGSLAVKLFSFGEEPVGDFWLHKFQKVLRLRETFGLTTDHETNAYRLIFSEGDGMPGLIIDFYDGTAVLQANSIGMYSMRQHFTECLQLIYGTQLKTVYDKSAETLRKQTGYETTDGFLFGDHATNVIREHGCVYRVDLIAGQKTGFFLDQRDNRQLVARHAAGKKILNTYCYSGGFSVAALKAGARLVHSVDSSKKAVQLTEENLRLNGFDPLIHPCIAVDAMQYLDQITPGWEIIILDPPAFAKHVSQRHKALTAYRHINREAIKNLAPGGLLFTFSCSQVVDTEQFVSIVMASAIEAGRQIKIIRHLGHPADHPVSIFHPEGAYLKGLMLYVE